MSSTWDSTVNLINRKSSQDEIGNPIYTETSTEVFANIKPIGRNEFYTAGQSGIEVNSLIIIHPYEYSDENWVEIDGEILRVIKTYKINQEELELTCGRKIGE